MPHINDHPDLLIFILQKLDGRSLTTAACVCRQWRAIVHNDSLWEHLCFRQMSRPPSVGVRSVVVALGGYRRLYLVCVRPVVGLLKRKRGESEVVRRVWSRREVELALSLFSVECYERLILGGGGVVEGDGEGETTATATAKSLKFLCRAVNG